MWLKCFKNQKFLCFVGGVATATLGVKALKSGKARSIYVKSLAKGMQIQKNAQEAFQNIKEDAADICYDANLEEESE